MPPAFQKATKTTGRHRSRSPTPRPRSSQRRESRSRSPNRTKRAMTNAQLTESLNRVTAILAEHKVTMLEMKATIAKLTPTAITTSITNAVCAAKQAAVASAVSADSAKKVLEQCHTCADECNNAANDANDKAQMVEISACKAAHCYTAIYNYKIEASNSAELAKARAADVAGYVRASLQKPKDNKKDEEEDETDTPLMSPFSLALATDTPLMSSFCLNSSSSVVTDTEPKPKTKCLYPLFCQGKCTRQCNERSDRAGPLCSCSCCYACAIVQN